MIQAAPECIQPAQGFWQIVDRVPVKSRLGFEALRMCSCPARLARL